MNGRMMNNSKIANLLEEKLKNYPNFLSGYYYSLRASNKELTSCREYITKAIHFLESINSNINDIDIKNIQRDNVIKYMINSQYKLDNNGNVKETSDSYQLMIWYSLKSFFDYLKKNDYIKENYILEIDKPKNNDLERINKDRILLTEDDFNKILASVRKGVGDYHYSISKQIRERDLAIMVLFMMTGMRRTALTEINISDINFETNTLNVIDKGNKLQEYYLNDSVINILKEWIERRTKINNIIDHEALFISNNGKRMTGRSVYNVVEKYCEDALGYKVSPHKLRAGFCSIMYKETGDIEKVRRMVGHANISTTQRYIVTDNKERMESSAIMGSKLKL